jgi:hypothetical protein
MEFLLSENGLPASGWYVVRRARFVQGRHWRTPRAHSKSFPDSGNRVDERSKRAGRCPLPRFAGRIGVSAS